MIQLLVRTFWACCIYLSVITSARADSDLEVRFQETFVTAGYSAAAGAAVGAALLAFQADPLKNLKFISIGASVGFLSGTALGTWYSLIPIFVDHSQPEPTMIADQQQSKGLVLRPWISLSENKLLGIEAGGVIARF